MSFFHAAIQFSGFFVLLSDFLLQIYFKAISMLFGG